MAYRRYCRSFTPGPVPPDILERLRRHLWLTAGLVLLLSIKGGTVEMFLLNSFSTSTAVGFFSIAFTLTRGAVELFSVGLTATLLPYMAKAYGQHGQAHAARFLAEATRFYWAAGIAIAGIGLVTTSDIVTLMYGQRYADAIPAIEVMLVLAGLLLIGNGIVAFQTVVDRQDDRIRIGVYALLANVLFGVCLIPHFGLIGAVVTYGATRVIEWMLAVYYLRRVTKDGIPWPSMLRLFLVGVVATAVAWLVRDVVPGRYAFVAGGMAFLAIYVPAGVLVRYWTDDDFALLNAIAERLGAPGRLVIRGLRVLRVMAAA